MDHGIIIIVFRAASKLRRLTDDDNKSKLTITIQAKETKRINNYFLFKIRKDLFGLKKDSNLDSSS